MSLTAPDISKEESYADQYSAQVLRDLSGRRYWSTNAVRSADQAWGGNQPGGGSPTAQQSYTRWNLLLLRHGLQCRLPQRRSRFRNGPISDARCPDDGCP